MASAYNESSWSDPAAEMLNSEISIEGTDSFGSLLSRELTAVSDEQEQNNGFNVFSVEVSGNYAVAEYEAVSDCSLVVAVYDESGDTMITSGITEVTADGNLAEVEFAGSVPRYFYLRAFLVASDTYRPLNTAFGSPLYTREMQEFLSKTVNDFDSEKVLNLDESESNNFAVFEDGTEITKADGVSNVIISADEVNQVYVIKNPNEKVTSLAPGDVFVQEGTDGEVLIIKVANMSIDGQTGNATMKGESTSLEEVFEFVKIDTEMTLDDEVGHSSQKPYANRFYAISGEDELGGTLKYSFGSDKNDDADNDDKKWNNDCNVKGSIDVSTKIKAKVYISWQTQYTEFTFTLKGTFDLSVEGRIERVFSFREVNISPFAGVFIKLKPKFVIRTEVSLSFNSSITIVEGFRISVQDGKQDLSKSPKVEKNVKLDGKIYVGFVLEGSISILSENLTKGYIKGEAGIELELTEIITPIDTKDQKHKCKHCLGGDIHFKFAAEAGIKFLNNDNWDFKIGLGPRVEAKLCDIYWCVDKNEFDLKKCPYIEYPVTLKVRNEGMVALSGAKIHNPKDQTMMDILTNGSGTAVIYLTSGTHQFNIFKEGYITQMVIFEVNDKKCTKYVKLSRDNSYVEPDVDVVLPIITLDDVTGGGAEEDDFVTPEESCFTYTINNNEVTITGYTGEYNKIRIPSIIEKYPVTSIGNFAFTHCFDLTSVTIPNGVIKIESYAFYRCTSLANITIPNSVTEIGSSAFSGCSALTAITVQVGNPSYLSENGCLYSKDKTLLHTVPGGIKDLFQIPAGVTSIGDWAFYDCSGLTSVTIPDGVTSIGGSAFCGCSGLTSITIPDGVTSIGSSAFEDCSGLTSITIPDSVASIGGSAFYYCSGLTSITLPDSVISIEKYSFYECSRLTSITIPNSVTLIGDYAFYRCSGLTSVTIPDGVTSIGDWAFSDCSNLLTIYGVPGSYAETYAKERNIPFVPLSNSESLTETATSAQYLSPAYEDAPYASADVRTAAYSGLIPNEIYNFYVMADKAAENALSPANLLFITQARTDAGGNLSVAYGYNAASAEPQILLKPMSPINISGAQMTVPNLTDHGITQFAQPTVTYLGEALAEDRDYTITGGDEASGAGSYTLTIEGTGDYTGTLSANYTVYPRTSVSAQAGNASVSLRWNPIAGASQYAVLFCKDGGQFTLNGYTSETQRTVTGLTNGTAYYFVVLSKIGEDWTTFMATDSVSAVPEGQSVQGESVKGVVKIYGANAAVTVELLDESGTVVDTVNSADGGYSFSGTENGKYSIRVSKSKYAPRTYPVTIGAATITLDAELRLYGDVDGDGEVGASDATQILRYTNRLSSVFDQDDASLAAYLLDVGNVFDDGELAETDATQILRYENTLSSVFDEIQ